MKLVCVATLLVLAAAPAEAVSGYYLEARTSDVYTGPCYANSEVNLVGKEAILAWRVEEGSWDGVDLADLSVVAVVSTRGLTHADYQCGNEIVYCDPLTAIAGATPAVTLEHRFTGEGLEGSLGKTWSSPNKRSAFVGTFEH